MASNEWQRNRYKSKRMEALKLLGEKCAKCGSIEYLEFDHIDPRTKERPMEDAFSCGKSIFLRELKKCQLLCRICHNKKKDKFCRKGHEKTPMNIGRQGRCLTCCRIRASYKKQ